MTLSAGARLGQYLVVSPLGAGGMGEVYRARDERLNRDVALKILPDDLREDRRALGRFDREAKAVAALSHPNIISIHHFDTAGPTPFFVMELLEGETLRTRILKSALPWQKAAEIGAQIAAGLAAAHARQIVHRDLKPANIFLTTSGQVKLLDFGLARGELPVEAANDQSTEIRTSAGAILGTPGYMSPEQASGEVVDTRTDIFSLGCVLYEMVTGRSPFVRPTASQSISAVLVDDVDTQSIDAPPELKRVIARCLQRDREQRFHSAHDVALDLRAALDGERKPIATGRAAVGGAIAAIAVAAVVGVATWWGRQPSPTVRSLAVLPFENATHGADTEFLSDGITEGLINTLSRLPNVRVVARTTAFTYKGKSLDLERVRRELDVDAILTGRVAPQSEGLTVQADLIDVDTNTQLWGDRYQQAVADPLAVEEQIVVAVMNRLNVPVTNQQRSSITAERTGSKNAYELYLRGMHEQNKRSPDGMRKARAYFQQAIDSDPTFAAAYVGLADTYILMGNSFRTLPKDEAHAKAAAAARRALELNPTAEARASLGLIDLNEFRWQSAEKQFREAIAMNPNYASAHLWYSLVLSTTDRLDAALREMRLAERLDPLSPHVASNTARVLNLLGDHAGAIREARKALDMNPNFAYAHWQIGLAHEYQGNYQLAADSYEQMTAAPPNMARAALGRAYAKLGRAEEARRIVQELESAWAAGQAAPGQIAWVYSALGEKDRAFFWLERALETRNYSLRDTLRSVTLSELRDDRRYADLLRRMLNVENAAVQTTATGRNET